MNDNMYIPSSLPVITSNELTRVNQQNIKNNNNSTFKSYLQQKINEKSNIKISAHAQKRLDQRNIELNQESMARLNDAVNQAEAKGARDTLVLMDQMALIVNIKNKTVITAMGQDNMNIFTQIDSAVII